MSHSVKLSIALNASTEIKVCEKIKKDIEELSKEYKTVFSNEIKELKDSLKEMTIFVESIKGESVETDNFLSYQMKMDSIKKRISNISSINIKNYIEKVESKDGIKINKIILDNGILATLAIQNIEENNESITSENLQYEINKIRVEKNLSNSFKEEISRAEKFIYESNLEIQEEDYLLGILDKSTSPQLLGDLYSIVGSMEIERKRISELDKIITTILVDMKFKVKKEETIVTSEGEIKRIKIFVNKLNKEFAMNIKDSGVDFKLGNYDKHLCESDSENFRNILKQQITVTDERITRNHSNDMPMIMAKKSRERGV